MIWGDPALGWSCGKCRERERNPALRWCKLARWSITWNPTYHLIFCLPEHVHSHFCLSQFEFCPPWSATQRFLSNRDDIGKQTKEENWGSCHPYIHHCTSLRHWGWEHRGIRSALLSTFRAKQSPWHPTAAPTVGFQHPKESPSSSRPVYLLDVASSLWPQSPESLELLPHTSKMFLHEGKKMKVIFQCAAITEQP